MRYREVMVVDGDSGPSGKRRNATGPISSVFASFLVVPLRPLHSTSGPAAFVRAPFRQGICMNSLQGFGKGVSQFCTILHHLYYTTQGWGIQLKTALVASTRASYHCA